MPIEFVEVMKYSHKANNRITNGIIASTKEKDRPHQQFQTLNTSPNMYHYLKRKLNAKMPYKSECEIIHYHQHI